MYLMYQFFRREPKTRVVNSVFLERSKNWGRERYRVPCNGHSPPKNSAEETDS